MTDSESDLEDWALLAKYVPGDASPAERARVERWIAAAPGRQAIVDQLRLAALDAAALVQPITPEAERAADDAAWRRLEEAVQPRRTRAPRIGPHVAARHARWWSRVAIAASIAVIAVGVLPWHLGGHPFQVVTRKGQRATVTFGDGTRVVLGVRAYPADGALRVVVRDGQVAVAPLCKTSNRGGCVTPAKTATLGAGDVAVVDSAGAAITHGVTVDDYSRWTEGRLALRDVPLREALVELARWYDLDVTLTDASVGERRVSGTFADVPAARVLDSISAAAGVRWVQIGRAVAVSPAKHLSR